MSGVRLRTAADATEWDGLVARHPGSTRYHGWAWLAEESRVYGWRFLPLVAERGGRAVGVVPLLVERGPLRRTPTVPHPYVGPLVEAGDLPDVLTALRRERRRRLLARITVGFTPGGAAAEALQASGWIVRADRTYAVDLTPHAEEARADDALLTCLHAKRRWRARRALRAGVEVRPVRRVDGLLVQVMEEAYRAHDGAAVVPPGLLPWIDRLLEDGTAVAIEARRGDDRLGVLVAVRSGSTMLGWLGGALASARDLDAGTVLYHELLRRAAAEGVERFDLVGHVDDGVAAFKRSLGAEPADYLEATDAALPLRLAKAVRARLAARGSDAIPAPERRAAVHAAPRSA